MSPLRPLLTNFLDYWLKLSSRAAVPPLYAVEALFHLRTDLPKEKREGHIFFRLDFNLFLSGWVEAGGIIFPVRFDTSAIVLY